MVTTETLAVSTAAKSALAPTPAPAPLNVLLMGNKEEDFFLIREILERTRSLLTADLDHAHSLEEARTMFSQKSYGLVLVEHEAGAEAVQFLTHFQQAGVPVPFIVLTENADEATVAEIIDGGGAW